MPQPMLEVTFDAGGFMAAIGALKRPQLDEAVAKALADTQKNTKVKAAASIAKHMGLRSARVKEAILTPFVRPGAWVAHVLSSRKPIPLIEFPGVRQTATGVFTRAWGRPQTILHAFIATMPTGHRGVYRRTGEHRLPIKQLWGPTIAGTFQTPDVRKIIETQMKLRLPINLKRRIRALQRRKS
jgi:hypothetical protein